MEIEVGKVFQSRAFGSFEIVKIDTSQRITVRFMNSGYTTVVNRQRVLRGSIRDRSLPVLFGVGVLGDKYPTSVGGKLLREYKIWAKMLERCYDKNYQKSYPTYRGCEVSENFKSYEYFYEWCNRQVGFENAPKWHLDKDLLQRGNKLYSENLCVFLPSEINVALTKSDAVRGDLPVGITAKKDKFRAECQSGGMNARYIGTFDTIEEAFIAYKEAKEIYLKTLAEEYKNNIDVRAYNALLRYKVSAND